MLQPIFQLVCALCAPAALTPIALVGTPVFTLSLPANLPQAGVQAPRPVPSAPFTGSLGTTIALTHARKLTLSATPSPTRCAPLVELAF